jgi:hypothetical protein
MKHIITGHCWPAASAVTAPPHPFCTPRGGLIIIPPICDEIGVR